MGVALWEEFASVAAMAFGHFLQRLAGAFWVILADPAPKFGICVLDILLLLAG